MPPGKKGRVWKLVGLDEGDWETLQRVADAEFGGDRQTVVRQAIQEILVKHGARPPVRVAGPMPADTLRGRAVGQA